MNQPFLLDPEYKNFSTRRQLKFDVLSDMNSFYSGCLALIALFATPFTIFFMTMVTQQIWLNSMFASEGRQVDATVISCEMRHTRGGWYPSITYSYWVDGVQYQDRAALDFGINCDSAPPNTTRGAVYLPSDLQESRLIGSDVSGDSPLIYILFVVVGLFMSVGTLAVVWLSMSYPLDQWRYSRLTSKGILLDGILITAKGEEDPRQNHYYLHVTYRVETPRGRSLVRKQKRRRDDLHNVPLPAAGTPVTVLYADDDACVML